MLIVLVPHTHWDREWYVPYSMFEERLGMLMDELREQLVGLGGELVQHLLELGLVGAVRTGEHELLDHLLIGGQRPVGVKEDGSYQCEGSQHNRHQTRAIASDEGYPADNFYDQGQHGPHLRHR